MSNDETNAYLQAKLQQAHAQESSDLPKKTPASKATKKAQTQPEEQSQQSFDMQAFRQIVQDVVRTELQTTLHAVQPAVDVQALRQIIEDVVRTELRVIRAEQPQPLDLQTFQHIIRTELQSVHTTLTLLAHAVQSQTDALMNNEEQEEDQEQDEVLGPSLDTDDHEDELKNVFPPNEDGEYEDAEDEDRMDGDEGSALHLPRPIPPTHRLRHMGPVGILLGSGDAVHPSTGTRRWEPPTL